MGMTHGGAQSQDRGDWGRRDRPGGDLAAGQEVLTALAQEDGGFALSFTGYDWGSSYYRQHVAAIREPA
jgi:hypothetical protein